MPSTRSRQIRTPEPIRLDYETRNVTWSPDDGDAYRIEIRGGYRNSKNMLLCAAVAEAQRYHLAIANPTSWPGVDKRFLESLSQRLFKGRPHAGSLRTYWRAFSKAGAADTPRCRILRPSRLADEPSPEGLFSDVDRYGYMFFGHRVGASDRYRHSPVIIEGAPGKLIRFVHDYYAGLSPTLSVPRERTVFLAEHTRLRPCVTF